ncbi:hypothetical protein LDENG_00015370 [Lucifuga dentata]|nr:hypothetical protein LDENG_00015370 [Lucifuga dentata]
MENDEERNDQQTEEQSVFPTAVSEENLEEARQKSTFKELFCSSWIFVRPREKNLQQAELQGSHIIQNKVLQHYSDGKEAMGWFQYEKAVICFTKAITLQPEQTQLYVSQAEAYLQLCDFQSAAVCYRRASMLERGAFIHRLAFIYYIQGQCLFDRGLFLEALEAFSKAAEMKPGCRAYKIRSLACLSAVGRYSDCVKLVNDWMVSDGPSADLYTLRARLHQQLNQMSSCFRDVKSALALNTACPEAGALLLKLEESGEQARQQAVRRALTGQLHAALCSINIALEHCPQDKHLYLFRGILYRRLKDFTAAIEDLVKAVELSEEEEEHEIRGQAKARKDEEDCGSVDHEAKAQLILTYNDFAVQCFSRSLYPEATLLLNKAIQEEKSQAGLYLNRGDCFFKQGEWIYSLADYQQAEEMMSPDDPAVRLRLAVIHNTMGALSFQEGCFLEAADMFSLAIHYNPTSSRYYENRAKAFRNLLNLEGAKQDLICMLILDPASEEVPPMLMSLFPSCSVSDVLSSPTGRAVRVQLMDKIQAFSCYADQQKSAEL